MWANEGGRKIGSNLPNYFYLLLQFVTLLPLVRSSLIEQVVRDVKSIKLQVFGKICCQRGQDLIARLQTINLKADLFLMQPLRVIKIPLS